MRYVLSLGSNCGERRENVKKALDWLSTILSDFMASPVYETPGVGVRSCGKIYFNAVASGNSDIGIEELSPILKLFELKQGRDSEARKRGDVPIDVDIVMAGNLVIRAKDFSAGYFQKGFQFLEERRADH